MILCRSVVEDPDMGLSEAVFVFHSSVRSVQISGKSTVSSILRK